MRTPRSSSTPRSRPSRRSKHSLSMLFSVPVSPLASLDSSTGSLRTVLPVRPSVLLRRPVLQSKRPAPSRRHTHAHFTLSRLTSKPTTHAASKHTSLLTYQTGVHPSVHLHRARPATPYLPLSPLQPLSCPSLPLPASVVSPGSLLEPSPATSFVSVPRSLLPSPARSPVLPFSFFRFFYVVSHSRISLLCTAAAAAAAVGATCRRVLVLGARSSRSPFDTDVTTHTKLSDSHSYVQTTQQASRAGHAQQIENF